MSNQEGPEFVTPGALSLSPGLPPSLVKVIEEARDQIAHRALNYRDAGETGERYAALLRQASLPPQKSNVRFLQASRAPSLHILVVTRLASDIPRQGGLRTRRTQWSA